MKSTHSRRMTARAVYVMTNEASGNRVILIKEAVT